MAVANKDLMLPDILRRIVRAKYIFERALAAEREETETATSVALLLTHDAVEMLMLAVLDHVGAKPSSKRNFMDFWSDMKQATGQEPADRIPLESLNKLRVGLKHNGNQPHQQTVRELLPRCKGFFENTLSAYCDLDYAAVSLMDMIADKGVIMLIKKAEESYSAGRKDYAMMHLKFAYHKVHDPEGRYLPLLSVPKRPVITQDLKKMGIGEYLQDLSSFLSHSARTTNANILKIDHALYMQYESLGPGIVWSWTGVPQVQFIDDFRWLTDEHFNLWRNFVVDFAIKAQAAYLPRPIPSSGTRPNREYSIEGGAL